MNISINDRRYWVNVSDTNVVTITTFVPGRSNKDKDVTDELLMVHNSEDYTTSHSLYQYLEYLSLKEPKELRSLAISIMRG